MRDKALANIDTVANAKKAAIVTGGNAGIGLETCYFLLRAGYHVIIGTTGEDSKNSHGRFYALFLSPPRFDHLSNLALLLI